MTAREFAASLTALAALTASAAALSADAQRIPAIALQAAPALDGDVSEWGSDGWQEVAVAPTVSSDERAGLGLAAEDRNATGEIKVKMKAGVHDGRIYFAFQWPDDLANTAQDVWIWNGARYSRSRRYEDMFALRFDMGGDYDRSMLSGKSYEADVWLWSASTSNLVGIAKDYRHVISTKYIDNAAEYSVEGVGTVYIKKYRDKGKTAFKTARPPKKKTEGQLPALRKARDPSGSYADVGAKGKWADQTWTLELSRALDTGNKDDRALAPGSTVVTQIGVFNHAADENKSISEPFVLDLSAIK